MLFETSLTEARNIGDLLDILRTRAKDLPAGTWLRGRGYDEQLFKEKRHPNRWEIDKISTKHPISLVRVDGHISAVNSEALRPAGVMENTADPDGGRYDRDASVRRFDKYESRDDHCRRRGRIQKKAIIVTLDSVAAFIESR